MRLSKELVERFQALHLEKYGEQISYDAAEQELTELAELVRITSKKENDPKNNDKLQGDN